MRFNNEDNIRRQTWNIAARVLSRSTKGGGFQSCVAGGGMTEVANALGAKSWKRGGLAHRAVSHKAT